MIISGNECLDNKKGFCVYVGRSKKGGSGVLYVGTTMQRPSDRFRWHRHNGKDLKFEVIEYFDNADEMLKKEKQLITEKKPKLNKRIKQNDNRRKSKAEIDARKGDKNWCQCCLRRRVNKGYTKCYYCS